MLTELKVRKLPTSFLLKVSLVFEFAIVKFKAKKTRQLEVDLEILSQFLNKITYFKLEISKSEIGQLLQANHN